MGSTTSHAPQPGRVEAIRGDHSPLLAGGRRHSYLLSLNVSRAAGLAGADVRLEWNGAASQKMVSGWGGQGSETCEIWCLDICFFL